MNSKLNPYLVFKGNARQAMEFYQSVFGGKLDMTTFKEGGTPHDPKDDNNIMHAMLVADNDITLMGSDAPMEIQSGSSISISLSGDNDVELSGYFEKLSAGGQIHEPLKTAPWGDKFGMFMDKFGIHWMVNITGKKA